MSAHTDNAARAARGSPASYCEGKHPFESLEQAREVATRSNRRRKRGYSAYLCPACSKWHLGTHKGRATAKKRLAFKQRKQSLE